MKKKVSLVLSGGGARGIAHIGVIEELEKQGFEIHSVVGTSMGSLIGGVYALGKMDAYKNWMYSLDKLEVFKLVDFTFSKQGLIKGDRVFNKMREFIPDLNIEDLNVNYSAVATDLLNRKEVLFEKGSIYNAIRASTAIPTVLTPIRIEGVSYTDGGVMNNVPISHAKRIDDDLLIAVHVNSEMPLHRPNNSLNHDTKKESAYLKKLKDFKTQFNKIYSKEKSEELGYFDIFNSTINLLTYQLSMIAIEKNPPDILIKISRESCGIFDFYKAEELVEMGRDAAKKSIERYQSK